MKLNNIRNSLKLNVFCVVSQEKMSRPFSLLRTMFSGVTYINTLENYFSPSWRMICSNSWPTWQGATTPVSIRIKSKALCAVAQLHWVTHPYITYFLCQWTLLYFLFLWEFIKDSVYIPPLLTMEELRNGIGSYGSCISRRVCSRIERIWILLWFIPCI